MNTLNQRKNAPPVRPSKPFGRERLSRAGKAPCRKTAPFMGVYSIERACPPCEIKSMILMLRIISLGPPHAVGGRRAASVAR